MAQSGRPRSFDETEIVNKAMMLFWEKGYENASLKDLEKATGLARVSLYNAIGDKEAVFIRTLDAYTDMAKAHLGEIIGTKGIDGLIAFFEGMSVEEKEKQPSPHGCLMINTILYINQLPETAKDKATQYRQMMLDVFQESLLKSIQDKSISMNEEEVQEYAQHTLATLWGVIATVRLFGDNKEVRPVLKRIARELNSLKI